MAAINNDWLEALQGEFKKPYYKKLFDRKFYNSRRKCIKSTDSG